jgi:peptidyl-prolyl cis-trans isomerase SurA
MRKLIFLIFFVCLVLSTAFSQSSKDVVVTIGKEKVYAGEFSKIYERNNGNIIDPAERKTPAEYLELYVNFKLKVLEARALGLDTSKAFIDELAGYRAELAAPYLTDVSYTEKLVEETYRRMTKEVNASHILITYPQNPSPEDTLDAYNKILEIKAEIEGGLDFREAASKYSEDPSAVQNQGELGWFTVFQMVTPFEDAAYSTPVGRISTPVRTRFGYHLLKVNGIRDASGEIKVAHIMKMFPPEMTPEMKSELKHTIDSLHALLKSGADFAVLARTHSDDQRSAANGGEMPFFGRSRMIAEFSDPAFALAKDGDFTGPVETNFGYHIIKRLELKPVPDFNTVKRELEESIKRDPERSTQSREIFINKLKATYQYRQDEKAVEDKISLVSTWFNEGTLKVPDEITGPEILFTIDGKNFTANDWFIYLKTLEINPADDPVRIIRNQYAAWEEKAIIEYEDGKLEDKYPEFKSLVQEYHDGLLLFAVSEKKIWQLASADTAGLMAFYETNKHKYQWGERYKGMIVSCSSPEIKEEVEDNLEQGIPVAEIYDMAHIDENNLQIIEGAWSKGENPIIDFYVWNGKQPDDWNPEAGFVRGSLAGPEPKLLGEARGFHISDYQQYLEEQWIIELTKKYPVKINKKVLKNIRNV